MIDNITSEIAKFSYMIMEILDVSSPFRIIILILDLLIVSYIIYYIYRLIKQTRAEQIVKGIIMLVMLLLIANLFNMVILKVLLTSIMTYGMLLFIVIFQPEIRSAFEKIGRSSRLYNVFDLDDDVNMMHVINEITNTCEILSLKKIGALIVIQRKTKVREITKEGSSINGKVSKELLQNIFTPRTPLHDGAVIIEDDKILAAKCILPLASESAITKNLGTRHRAAVGITEISDSIAIVVSEETGSISLSENGKLKYDIKVDKVKSILTSRLFGSNRKKKYIKNK